MHPFWDELCETFCFSSPQIVYGGDSRWQSVKNAIDSIENITSDSIITIHDGARPLVNSAMIARVIAGVSECDGAIPVVPVTDSLRQVAADGTSAPIDRSSFRAVQTPQAFRAIHLTEAYALPFDDSFTDDASVMAAAGYTNIALVDGDTRNIKITNPSDIEIASILMHRE